MYLYGDMSWECKLVRGLVKLGKVRLGVRLDYVWLTLPTYS
jgi:hypothetical protein